MTATQRRKQNYENSLKSTGPKTEAGKEIARQNALKHGLRAETLTLPDESPEELQFRAEAWFEAVQPETHDEEMLVDQLVLDTLRIERLAKAEAEVLNEQVRNANSNWFRDRSMSTLEYVKLQETDPARALILLKNCGGGVEYLLNRWKALHATFEANQFLSNLGLIKVMMRLEGSDPECLRDGSANAYVLAVRAVACVPDHENNAELTNYLKEQMHPECVARIGVHNFKPDEARAALRDHLRRRIAELTAADEDFQAIDDASLAGAATRATVPEDTARNRLMLRYARGVESSFNRTLKTLTKLQSDRQKEFEKGAKMERRAAAPNEARVRGKAYARPIHPGSYVTLNEKVFIVQDTSDGTLMLLQVVPLPEKADSQAEKVLSTDS
jgi:hypothetical protein